MCVFFVERERKNMDRRFDILDRNTRRYRRYNGVERLITARLIPPSENSDPVIYFLASVNDLFEHVLLGVGDSGMVGITIRKQVNQNDKPIRIIFRRKDQLSADVIWSVFEKVCQSDSRFDALDTMVVTVHSVRMPVDFGKRAIQIRGRALSVFGSSQYKYSGGESGRELFSPCTSNIYSEGGK